jgi:signal transduction histidine kinase
VDICDSGPGIAAEHLDRIFEEYTSYSGGHDRSGGGLGLAICKLILSQHQGRVWAENSSEGAVFSFVLPFRLTDLATSAHSNGLENGFYAGAV